MANPFAVQPVNILQALMMGTEGYDRGQKAMQQGALNEAGQLYASGDVKGAQAAAARGGSLQALMGFAGLNNQDRDFAFRQTEAGRAQENANRGFGLQEKQVNATIGSNAAQRALAERQFQFNQEVANRADIREMTDANGNKSLVRVDRQGNASPVNVPGQAATEPNNPFATNGAMTEAQSKDGLYANRMMNAEKIFRDPAVMESGTSRWERGKAMLPAGNSMVSPNYQKFDQAQRDFVNATLRRESGAVISDSEFDNARKQYFPQPGDGPEVLAQKQANRVEAIKGIGSGAGKAWKPKYTFDQGGNLVDRQAAPQQGGGLSEGMTATNPQTGQRIMFKGGQWIPAQ